MQDFLNTFGLDIIMVLINTIYNIAAQHFHANNVQSKIYSILYRFLAYQHDKSHAHFETKLHRYVLTQINHENDPGCLSRNDCYGGSFRTAITHV